MAKILEMPKLSPTMEEGVLSAWHKNEGDAVAVDDLLAEVETDKATMEFRSFDAGTLLKILAPAGAAVKLGQPVAVLGAPGEDISAMLAQASPRGASTSAPPKTEAPSVPSASPAPSVPSAPSAPPAPSVGPPVEPPAAAPPPASVRETAPPPALRRPPVGHVLDRTAFAPEAFGEHAPVAAGGRILASPYLRKVARDMGVDLRGAQGSGPGGRLQASDLEPMRTQGPQALARPSEPAPIVARAASLEEAEARPLSLMRKTIARRLTESKQTVPHFYLTIDVDASALMALRERINDELRAQDAGDASGAQPLKVTVNDLLIKACAVALTRVPDCNASFTPEAILVHKRVDISVAVAIPDGLVTPVVRRADQKSVVAIAREVRELGGRARAKKLKPEEMTDGTFSISNLGMFGVDQFAAVINPPEGAILAVGQVRGAPVVHEGSVVPGKRLGLTLSCDHRVVDGAVGAAFLAELRRLVEHPLRVLTG
jgi:pyruvate dehydrogenase E2 component (dihydrolipoamide acetyltransferase)